MNTTQHAILPTRLARRGTCALACMLAFTVALSGCGGGGDGGGGKSTIGNNADTKVRVAPNPTDNWTLVPAAEVGMDAAVLADGVASLSDASSHGMSSMLVTRRGKPVLEQYWNGYDKDTLHDLRSATKSITSLLMGVAIDQRLVGGVGDTLSSYLNPLYPNAPAYRLGLKLEDMLTMRSGLDCDDWTRSSPGNEENMYQQTDWVKFYVNLQAPNAPGSVTRYCTGNPMALGRVIAVASKKPIPAFANEFLFGPLNIQSARWAEFDNRNQTDTGGHIHMRPRDMVKLGQLALQKGQWNGKQLVSAAWMAESTRQHTQFTSLPNRNGYGYFWWRSVETIKDVPYDVIFADGNGGQYIMIVPALDIVAVFTGENYNLKKAEFSFSVLNRYILPAVK
ncbi:serine hydrolase domain-containing protein [Massilia scottii]|uniref:serine hydrolase domain-containing protein n=1 Tax=Massilia scottii TaxID=3057166 RepID=UPI002796E13D|nr:serine hydrolase [Massilia sp. CCM 9029]MDQ1833617.1 serine hydrolase [Massilia sp. CCM 9029]